MDKSWTAWLWMFMKVMAVIGGLVGGCALIVVFAGIYPTTTMIVVVIFALSLIGVAVTGMIMDS